MHRRNLLVAPLDRRGEWYRYHHLLRDLLRAELRRDDPELFRTLHSRAAAWYEANGAVELAIEHAHAAGDDERFAELRARAHATGLGQRPDRHGAPTGWSWIGTRPSDRHHLRAIAAHGALIFALLGAPRRDRAVGSLAETPPDEGTLPDGTSVAATLAYLRANLCRHGPAEMRLDARQALAGLGPTSPYRATMLHTEGLSYLLEHDLDRADAAFAHATTWPRTLGSSPLAALVLAEQLPGGSRA